MMVIISAAVGSLMVTIILLLLCPYMILNSIIGQKVFFNIEVLL